MSQGCRSCRTQCRHPGVKRRAGVVYAPAENADPARLSLGVAGPKEDKLNRLETGNEPNLEAIGGKKRPIRRQGRERGQPYLVVQAIERRGNEIHEVLETSTSSDCKHQSTSQRPIGMGTTLGVYHVRGGTEPRTA